MGFLDTVLNLDVALMTAESRAWAASEERKAERRYNKYVKNHSEEKKEEDKKVDEAEKCAHPEDDAPETEAEVTVIESPNNETSEEAKVEVVVENVVHDNNEQQMQHGPDFTELQKAEVNLEPGVSYTPEVNNPALTQLNQDPNLAIEAAISNIIGQNSALQNLDKSTLNLIVKNSIDTAIADIIKKNPDLQHIDTEMLNATLREMAKSIPNSKENK